MNPETGEALQVVLVTEPTSSDFTLCDPSMVALNSAATTEVNLSESQEEESKKEDNASAGSLSVDTGHSLEIGYAHSGIENGFGDEMVKVEDLPSETASNIEPVENVLLDYNVLEAAESDSEDGGHPLETASVHTVPEREADDFSSCLQLAKEDGNNTLLLQCESSAPGSVCFVNIVDSAHVPKVCGLNSIENGLGVEMVKVEDLRSETASNIEPVENVMLDHNVSVAAESDSMGGGHPLETASVHTVPEREADDFSRCLHLPKEAGKNTILLQCESSAPGGVCFINIVGTAHVSKASCAEVQALIQHVKPQHVFLELCSSRVALLLPLKVQVPTLEKMVEMYKKKEMNLFGIMYSWFLAKVGEKMEVQPGMEFRVGYEEAVKCGAEVALGDRPIQITLRRAWGTMSMWSKAKLIYSILSGCIFMPTAEELAEMMKTMEETDEITFMIQELSKSFPTLSETLIRERDLYMVASLRSVARNSSSVVAVVGRGHLTGIANNWKEDIDVEELILVPAQRPFISSVTFRSAAALLVGGLAVVAGVHYMKR